MIECKPLSTPIEANAKICAQDDKDLEDATMYKQLAGSLIYLTLTRPDISYAVGIASQFMEKPKKPHLELVRRILSNAVAFPVGAEFPELKLNSIYFTDVVDGLEMEDHTTIGHGAWVWVYYKLKPRVKAAGHQFTPLSLAAAGNSPKKLEEVRTLHYTKPLLEFLDCVPEGEKVFLAGHSGGGYAAAYGMEKHPGKISGAVSLNALMPDTKNRPSYVIDEVY
ncbi:Methylesterase 8 [Striga hermonthica]|uniref:Methylesterase 8 n=1 Tax=Striga hermonthica TaxID=68872 RepID=A0A9N7NEN8_STRHE|nr:Methylesterase 8 [Striga hermonthica]